VSPDGSRVAFLATAATGSSRLWVRALDTLTAQELPDCSGEVRGFFAKPGAYAKFKDLLAERGGLEAWYAYEANGVERALRALIDTSADIAVLFDHKYRLVHSSPRHRELLRLDASELYGRPFQRLQSQSQAVLLDSVGGADGWWRNGVVTMEVSLLRNPFEGARNLHASAQRGTAWSIRDGLETPLVLGITREIPMNEYKPHQFAFTTLDDAVA
jgi:PAS domain-containing protein